MINQKLIIEYNTTQQPTECNDRKIRRVAHKHLLDSAVHKACVKQSPEKPITPKKRGRPSAVKKQFKIDYESE